MTITSWVRIMASVAMVVVAGATVAGATGAFFSSTQTSTGNTFTAGTLSLNVTGGSEFSTTTPFTVSGMMPGATSTKNAVFKVTNNAWFQGSLTVTAKTATSTDVAFAGALTFTATLKDDLLAVIPLSQSGTTLFTATSTPLDPARTYTLAITTTLPSGTGDAAQGGSANADLTLKAVQSANNPTPTF